MKIAEAANKWGVKPEKVVEYLYVKEIEGVTCNGAYVRFSDLEIPDIPKPDNKCRENEKTQDGICRKILKGYANNRYVNAAILGISRETFEHYLAALAENGYLSLLDKPDEPCLMLCYSLTKAGEETVSGRKINLNLNPSFNLIHMS